MGVNLFFMVVFSIGTAIVGWKLLKSTMIGAITLFNTNSSTNNILGEGKKESKVKFLDKKPVENPYTANGSQVNGNANSNGREPYIGNPQIPYYTQMGGGDNANMLQGTSALAQGVGNIPSGLGGGLGVSATVGLVNVVGIHSQNGNGQIKNINKARKLHIGNFSESASAISNIKLKASKDVIQNALDIKNSARRVNAMNQGGQNFNTIARGRNMNQTGISSNFIQGNVKRIKAAQNMISTTNLKMRPISRVQNLNVQNFVAKKGLAMRLRNLANGLPFNNNVPRIEDKSMAAQGGENIQFNVNDLNVQRNSNFQTVNQQIFAGMQTIQNEVEKRKVFDNDPKNKDLNDTEKTKVYNISRYLEQKTVGMPVGQYVEQKKKNEKIMDSVRAVVKVYPKATEQNLLEISRLALEKNKQRDEGRKAIAFQQASNGQNYDNDTRKQVFDEKLKGSQAANIRMEDWVNKNFSEQINSISDERMQEIRKQAEEYELKSRTTSMEEKEANHARETGEEVEEFDSSDYYGNVSEDQNREKIIEQKVEELTNEEIQNNRNSVIEAIKDQFIENPDDFRGVLGDEFVDKYNEAVNGSDKEFQKRFVEELAKIDNKEQKEFLKKNPDKQKQNYYEIYKARKQAEFNQDIVQSARELYGSNGQKTQVGEDLANGTPQPQVTSESIYIPRYVQDQMIDSGNA